MTDAQGAMLAAYAERVPPGRAIVEVGSHHGRSTIVLALCKSRDVRLMAVDPFEDPYWGGGEGSLPVFLANLERAGVREEVEFFRGYGEQLATTWTGDRVGLLYLDGAHDYRTVDRELGLWFRHLAPGAIVLCHDMFSSHGVTRAAVRQVLASRRLSYIERTGSLAAFEYRPLSVTPHVATLVRLSRELPYFLRNIIVKVALRRGWTPVVRALGHHGDHDPF
jgi:predicted O-methyltransferase YrrM